MVLQSVLYCAKKRMGVASDYRFEGLGPYSLDIQTQDAHPKV